MVEDFKNWSRDEFLAFILIEASFADRLIQADEKSVITKLISFVRYDELLKFYRINTKEQNKEVMTALKDKFVTSEREKDDFLSKIRSIFLSDGQFSQTEKDLEKAFNAFF